MRYVRIIVALALAGAFGLATTSNAGTVDNAVIGSVHYQFIQGKIEGATYSCYDYVGGTYLGAIFLSNGNTCGQIAYASPGLTDKQDMREAYNILNNVFERGSKINRFSGPCTGSAYVYPGCSFTINVAPW